MMTFYELLCREAHHERWARPRGLHSIKVVQGRVRLLDFIDPLDADTPVMDAPEVMPSGGLVANEQRCECCGGFLSNDPTLEYVFRGADRVED